ncbi:MAG: radical SAM protein [Cyanobium sp.]
MRVLLIYPRFPRTFWSFDRAVALMGHRVLLPPLGLITVAALLPQSWQFRLVDCNVRDVSEADWPWADLVILSAMLVQKRDLAQQIQQAKAHGCRVAVGGPFASSTPDAPELQAADYLVLDEGEITLPMLVEALQNGEAKGRFSAAGAKPDLTTTPVPRFDLLELNAYAMLAVQFSRGCPFQCEFCDIIVLYGRKPRTKTADQLLAELEAIRRLNWRGEIFLVDDNFIGNRRHVHLLLPKLAEWQRQHGHPFAFTTEASIDLADDDELMTLMTGSGFNRVFLGIETPDIASLTTALKHQNTRSPLLEAVDTITARGLLVMAGFILGFDGEQAGAGERIVDFVNQSAIPVAMVGILQALPNTALWQRLDREQRLLKLESEFDAGVQTNLLNFLPSRPIEQIASEFIEAFDQLYEPSNYLNRIYRYSTRLGRDRAASRLSFQSFLDHLRRPQALIGMLTLFWNQGLIRKTRWSFWRYLLLTAIQRPQVLDQYLWMALLNEHFLEYRSLVRREVSDQLRWSRSHLPARASA